MKTAAENAPVGKFSRSQVLMAQVMRTSSVTLAPTLTAFVTLTFEARGFVRHLMFFGHFIKNFFLTLKHSDKYANVFSFAVESCIQKGNNYFLYKSCLFSFTILFFFDNF